MRQPAAPVGRMRAGARRANPGVESLLALLLAAGGLAGCGTLSAPASVTAGHRDRAVQPNRVPDGDWSQFNFNAQRTGAGPANTGITAANVGMLQRRVVHLPGTADSTAIVLQRVQVKGRRRDVIFLTTSYGRTIAIDAASGAKLWEFTPGDIRRYEGSARITNASPTADPSRRYIYAVSPDGYVRKLSVATGRPAWSAKVTYDPTKEKLASPPSIDGSALIVVTDGYLGDAPHYQGHVVSVDRASGRIAAVWNSLCSRSRKLIVPVTCAESDGAIWGRSGAVIEPGTHRILVTTGNGAFNGSTYWGDSVLELSPNLKLLHNWTPSDQAHLNATDTDLGSTSPALLPETRGLRLVVQGGKSGQLKLLNLNRLDGSTGPAGPRTGGELQSIDAPGPTGVFSEPAVWSHGGRSCVFVADGGGTAAYVLNARRRLQRVWGDTTPGSSPVIAGNLLYVYDHVNGGLVIRHPLSGRKLDTLHTGAGHWESPTVVGGRVILPEGDVNRHATSGVLDIYHLPGR